MPTTPSGRGLGVIFAPPDARNFPYSFVAPPLAAPPPDIDLRAQMQPVGDQGQLGSCTGWAGTASLESRLRDGQRSALYVYARDRQEDGTPLNQDAGASMLGLCKALKDYGAPPESAWPYDISRFSQAPPASADQAAAGSQVDAYFQIKATGLTLLQGVWDALRQGQTVLVALYVYQEFESIGPDGKAPMPRSGSRPLGGHAICACGWWNDNSAPGGYGWVMCQNSWGPGFGDIGYVYLPAAYFTSGIVMECWVLQEAAPAPPPEPPPSPPPGPDPAPTTLRGLVNDAYQQVSIVAADPTAEWPAGTIERAKADLLAALPLTPPDPGPTPPPGPVPPPTPPPTPPPPTPPVDEDWKQLVSGMVGLAGQQKWLPGSTGIDIFVRRNTVVKAPIAGRVSFQRVPGGPMLIGEMIIANPDGRTVRYRHVAALVQPGSEVAVGDPIAITAQPVNANVASVNDPSMDMLHWPAGYPIPPDGYQHLDVSLASRPEYLNPQGGAGGNVPAYQHIWGKMGGIPGIQIIPRTPGPPEGSRTPHEQAAWLRWADPQQYALAENAWDGEAATGESA